VKRLGKIIIAIAFCVGISIPFTGRAQILNEANLASQYYGASAPWYVKNIPFLETSDQNIQQVYYYRWGLVNEHLRFLPDKNLWVMTEFSHDVWWASADQTIDAAAGHHIDEARWLRDPTYDNNYIQYWMTGNGNGYAYSNWIANSVYKQYLATGDLNFAKQYLPALKTDFQNWTNLRYDPTRQMYWETPLADATEGSVADQMTNGTGAYVFRPSINSYMYGSATAISRLAQLTGDSATAQLYAGKAAAIKSKVQSELWNPSQQHFMDRFTSANPGLDYQFVDSRELVGYVPWYFELPDDSSTYSAAWNHLTDPTKFAGPYGLRTVEQTSPHYFNPPGPPVGPLDATIWNGPSWPFQTSMVLGGMANALDDYTQSGLTNTQYVNLLRQFTLQQYKNGHPYIAEDYNPDTGNWIVDVPNRSEDYFHSTYNDLIVTGLAGLRPRADNIIEVKPLIDSSISYFCLQDIPYHGRDVTILWDRDNRYGKGAGLHVIVNGLELAQSSTITGLEATMPFLGDADLNGRVDIGDLLDVAQHFSQSGDWHVGDFNGDGLVDITDLRLLAQNWGSGTNDAPQLSPALLTSLGLPLIPEPAGLGLAAALILVGIQRRNRAARSWGCSTAMTA
jgi:Trehalase